MTTGRLRPEIDLAWRRAEMCGLEPGMQVRETAAADFDRRSSLRTAANPVLDQMVDQLADTRFSILLADRTSRIIDRRAGDPAVTRALDQVLAVPGFQYLEELSGTNALATAYELRQPIAVTGDEHYLEALRCFCCYGAPIVHPITHRLEGVLDVSGPAAEKTGLLGPFVTRAAKDIEERLLEGSRVAEKHLLAEFQTHCGNRSAVVVLGENMVLTNTAAADLVAAEDHVALRAIAADLSSHSAHDCHHVLHSGAAVALRVQVIAGTRGGALFEIEHAEHPRRSGPRARVSTRPAGGVTVVTGESGTGRTTAAQKLAGPECTLFDCSDSLDDETRWCLAVREALHNARPLVIDNVDALSARSVAALTSALHAGEGRSVLTSVPPGEVPSAHCALMSLALNRHELTPLRLQPLELAGFVRTLLGQIVSGSSLRIAPSALQRLSAHSWPGNLRELRSVLEFAARDRDRGVIVERDLPEALRVQSVSSRPLTLMESVERDAIVSALRAASGNRAATAVALGIGRTTLYDRLRRYRIANVGATEKRSESEQRTG